MKTIIIPLKYRVQNGFKAKGTYKTRYTVDSIRQASLYYQGINIGRGYKKRVQVSRDSGMTWKTVHRTTRFIGTT